MLYLFSGIFFSGVFINGFESILINVLIPIINYIKRNNNNPYKLKLIYYIDEETLTQRKQFCNEDEIHIEGTLEGKNKEEENQEKQEEEHQELQQNKTQSVQEEVLRREPQREHLSRMFQTWHCQGWNSRQFASGGIGLCKGGRPG